MCNHAGDDSIVAAQAKERVHARIVCARARAGRQKIDTAEFARYLSPSLHLRRTISSETGNGRKRLRPEQNLTGLSVGNGAVVRGVAALASNALHIVGSALQVALFKHYLRPY